MGTNKLLSWWIGPCPIVDRRGADSYVINDKPGHRREVHSSQLKPYVEDQHADAAFPLHYWRMTEADVTDEVDEWEVDEKQTTGPMRMGRSGSRRNGLGSVEPQGNH